MSSVVALYIINILTNLDSFLLVTFGGISIVTLILGVIMCATLEAHDEDDFKKYFKAFKTALFIAISIALISLPIPSTEMMYLMLGANYLNKSEIPTKVERVLNQKLDEYLAVKKDDK